MINLSRCEWFSHCATPERTAGVRAWYGCDGAQHRISCSVCGRQLLTSCHCQWSNDGIEYPGDYLKEIAQFAVLEEELMAWAGR